MRNSLSSLLPFAALLLLAGPSHASDGAVCTGGSECEVGAGIQAVPTIVDNTHLIRDWDFYQQGARIICVPYNSKARTQGSFCLVSRGDSSTNPNDGVFGTILKDKVRSFPQANCKGCGSVSLSPQHSIAQQNLSIEYIPNDKGCKSPEYICPPTFADSDPNNPYKKDADHSAAGQQLLISSYDNLPVSTSTSAAASSSSMSSTAASAATPLSPRGQMLDARAKRNSPPSSSSSAPTPTQHGTNVSSLAGTTTSTTTTPAATYLAWVAQLTAGPARLNPTASPNACGVGALSFDDGASCPPIVAQS